MEAGIQLKLFEDGYGANHIIFHVHTCTDDCPLQNVYKGTIVDPIKGRLSVFIQRFASHVLMEPEKWLLIVERESPRWESERYGYYIEDDWVEAFAKVEDLTNRIPKFRLDPTLENASQLGH